MVAFFFLKPTDFIGKIICFLTRGKFCHVAICIDSVVYEAKAGKGVEGTYLSVWSKGKLAEVELIEDKKDDRTLNPLVSILQTEIGSKYDYLAIFSFLFFAKKQSKKRWFCSELANQFFIQAGEKEDGRLISPNEFYTKVKAYKMGIENAKKNL